MCRRHCAGLILPAVILERIFIAQGHAYFGRHGQPAAAHPMEELERAECVTGRGLRGDRFFGYRPDYKGQVTLFAREVWEELATRFDCSNLSPAALRRNLLVRGTDINALMGETFTLGEVTLAGVEECRPCYWMDRAIAPGAEDWLKGRGGLRCRVLTDGWLHATAAVLGTFAQT